MVGVKIAFGTIHSVNEKNYTATVKIEEDDGSITGELQVLSTATFQNKVSELPEVQSPCVVLMFADDSQRGVIVGSRFSTKNPCDLSSGKKIISYKKSNIVIDENGEITIECEKLKINSMDTVITSKKIKLDGDVEITKGLKLGGEFTSTSGVNIGSSGVITAKEVIKAKDFIKI